VEPCRICDPQLHPTMNRTKAQAANNNKSRRRPNPNAMIRIGSLPAARASSVDILRAKPRDNEVYQFDLQIIPLAFTVSSGVCKQRFQFQSAAVSILSTLFQAFEEFRFVGARLKPRIMQAYSASTTIAPTGYFKIWIDDAILSAATPTYTDAFSRQTVDVQIAPPSQATSKQELQWVATDNEDLDWISIPTGSPTTFVPFTVVVFAGTGSTPGASAGTMTSATDSASLVSVDGAVRVQFRTLRTI